MRVTVSVRKLDPVGETPFAGSLTGAENPHFGTGKGSGLLV
jgi:hypothetical protein